VSSYPLRATARVRWSLNKDIGELLLLRHATLPKVGKMMNSILTFVCVASFQMSGGGNGAERAAAPLWLQLDRLWVQQLRFKVPKMLAAVDDSAAVLLAAVQRLAVVGHTRVRWPSPHRMPSHKSSFPPVAPYIPFHYIAPY
jgi:hypothetical protein